MSAEVVAGGGRANQRARTRAALVGAAVELVREGRPPSVPDAAERALVSVATAYRYFPSAEELWSEASSVAADLDPFLAEAEAEIEAAGDDVQARMEANVRTLGWRMLEDQVPFRQLARAALDRWFRQLDVDARERVPVREARRNRINQRVVEPLRGVLDDGEVDRLVAALALVVGTDAMIALTDVVGLEPDDAKALQADAARWLLAGALAELGVTPTGERL